MIIVPTKDPADEENYGLDWSDNLGSATITTSAWAVSPSGLTITGDSFSNDPQKLAIVWVEGGSAGVSYKATNTITTSNGRTVQRSILIPVDER